MTTRKEIENLFARYFGPASADAIYEVRRELWGAYETGTDDDIELLEALDTYATFRWCAGQYRGWAQLWVR